MMEKRKPYIFDKEAAFNHYVGDLKKGEAEIVEGAIVGNELELSKEEVLIAGFPLEISKRLNEIFIEEDKLEKSELTNNIKESKERARKYKECWQKSIDIITDYYAEFLPPQKQDLLKTLNHKTMAESQKIFSEFENRTIKYEDVTERYARLLGAFAYEEMDIFKDEKRAQRRRYRNWTGTKLPDKEQTITEFVKAFTSLISGDYLKQTHKIENQDSDNLLDQTQSTGTTSARMNYSYKPEALPHPPEFFVPIQIEVEEYAEENICWSVRIYSAEHPVVPEPVYDAMSIFFDWEDIFHEIGAVHTSVLVGIFEVYQVRTEERTINNDTGEILETKYRTRIYHRLDEWVVANGSASWFKENDRLLIKKEVSYYNRSAAEKYAKSSTPDSKEDKYFPIRACAYSVGNINTNWVCHQNCNAFTRRKYALICVTYPSQILYDNYSNHPLVKISRKDCPISIGTEYGGVPGNNLHYHFYPIYWNGDPTTILIEMFMNRDGVGLRDRWNPSKGEWQPTYARLVDQPASAIGISGFTRLRTEFDWWM